MECRSRPPVSLDRDFDAAMDLALQLAILRQAHGLDEIVLADLEGTPLSSAGDPDASRALGAFAAAMLRGTPVGTSRAYHCGRVHVELLSLGGSSWVLAAKAAFLVSEPEALSMALCFAFATGRDAGLDDEPRADAAADSAATDGFDDFQLGWELPGDTAAA